MLSLDEKTINLSLFSHFEKQKNAEVKIIPTLGLTCSHRGTDLFPVWD